MELEEFAFQGCPDVRGPQKKQSPEKALNSDGEDKNVSSKTYSMIDQSLRACKSTVESKLQSCDSGYMYMQDIHVQSTCGALVLSVTIFW